MQKILAANNAELLNGSPHVSWPTFVVSLLVGPANVYQAP